VAEDIEKHKTCGMCYAVKSTGDFHKNTKTKDGLGHYCKPCCSAYRREHYAKNKERTLAVNRAWAAKNPENVKNRSAKWYAENTERHHDLMAARYARHRDGTRAQHRVWYAANKEARAETVRKWQDANPESRKASAERYRKANPEKLRVRYSLQRQYRGHAVPLWLTDAQKADIVAVYASARMLTKMTGVLHHVDHIVPLRGKFVCGLHVPWNLQILTAYENQKKSNRHAA
jgi:hypothetical protein